MHRAIVIIAVFFLSCQSPAGVEKLHGTLSGNWLILYPDHKLKNGLQRELYSKMQDSIVGLKGLKLVSLDDDGTFRQADSLDTKGRWGITADNKVFVENGGKGFEHYSANYTSYKKGLLKLTELVDAEGEKIKLVWHLKKIAGGSASELFKEERNVWRKRPGKTETEKEIKKRLSEMLQYYSDYYELVTKESSFFVPARVILPFKFYQHAIGMKSFDEAGSFAKLFYSKEQAEQAHHYLSVIIRRLRHDFPKRENYVEEYAAFMEQMAAEIIPE